MHPLKVPPKPVDTVLLPKYTFAPFSCVVVCGCGVGADQRTSFEQNDIQEPGSNLIDLIVCRTSGIGHRNDAAAMLD